MRTTQHCDWLTTVREVVWCVVYQMCVMCARNLFAATSPQPTSSSLSEGDGKHLLNKIHGAQHSPSELRIEADSTRDRTGPSSELSSDRVMCARKFSKRLHDLDNMLHFLQFCMFLGIWIPVSHEDRCIAVHRPGADARSDTVKDVAA